MNFDDDDDDLFGDREFLKKVGLDKKFEKKFFEKVSYMTPEDAISELEKVNIIDEIQKNVMHFNEFVQDTVRNNNIQVFEYLIERIPEATYEVLQLDDQETMDMISMYVDEIFDKPEDEKNKMLSHIISHSLSKFVEIYLISYGEFSEEHLKLAARVNLQKDTYASNEIYNLIKSNIESNKTPFRDSKKDFCKKRNVTLDNMIIPRVLLEYKISIPCYKVIPEKFNISYLTNPPDMEFSIIKANIKGSNYLESINSIINDNKFNFDLEWIQDCNRYIANLSMADKFTIYGYTKYGDEIAHYLILNPEKQLIQKIEEPDKRSYFYYYFQVVKVVKDLKERGQLEMYAEDPTNINEFADHILSPNIEDSYNTVINKKVIKLFTDAFWKLVTQTFIQDLQRIIANAPPIKKESYVYRGVKTHYYSTNKKKTFKSLTFLSTAFEPTSALKFTSDGYCCMKKIILPSGSRAIVPEFLTQFPGENEILLNIDSEFEVLDHEITTYYNDVTASNAVSDYRETPICDMKTLKPKMITTMRLINK